MTELSESQFTDNRPPEVEKILVIGVDATSRVYDLSTIDLGTLGSEVGANKNQYLFVTLLADGGDVYWSLSPTGALTIDNTAAVAAGAALAFTNTKCWRCPQNVEQRRRMDRGHHRYLYLKTASSTATARIHVSSAPPPGAILP